MRSQTWRSATRASLSAEPVAWNAPCRVQPFFIVDAEREEVDTLTGKLGHGRGGKHHRIAFPDSDGATSLSGQKPRLDDYLTLADARLKLL